MNKVLFVLFLLFFCFCVCYFIIDDDKIKTCYITSVELIPSGEIYASWIIDGVPYCQLLHHKDYLPYLYEALESEYKVVYNIFITVEM